jgi:hypothetical protein
LGLVNDEQLLRFAENDELNRRRPTERRLWSRRACSPCTNSSTGVPFPARNLGLAQPITSGPEGLHPDIAAPASVRWRPFPLCVVDVHARNQEQTAAAGFGEAFVGVLRGSGAVSDHWPRPGWWGRPRGRRAHLDRWTQRRPGLRATRPTGRSLRAVEWRTAASPGRAWHFSALSPTMGAARVVGGSTRQSHLLRRSR